MAPQQHGLAMRLHGKTGSHQTQIFPQHDAPEQQQTVDLLSKCVVETHTE